MFVTLAYIIALLKGNLFLLSCFTLFVITQGLFSISKINLSVGAVLVFYAALLAIPLAAWISGLLVERSVLKFSRYESISKLCFVLTCALCLRNNQLIDCIYATLQLLQGPQSAQPLFLLVRISSACLLAAGVVAFCMLFLLALLELPFVWFNSAFSFTSQADITLAGARPLAFLILTVFAIDLIMSFLGHKLWPTNFNV